MQGAQKLRSEAHSHVRRNDEVECNAADGLFDETINYRSDFVAPGIKLQAESAGYSSYDESVKKYL